MRQTLQRLIPVGLGVGGLLLMFGVALLVGALGPAMPEDVARQWFAVAHAGDIDKLQAYYSRPAWDELKRVYMDSADAKTAIDAFKREWQRRTLVRVEPARIDGKEAVVRLTVNENGEKRDIQVRLSKEPEGWRVREYDRPRPTSSPSS